MYEHVGGDCDVSVWIGLVRRAVKRAGEGKGRGRRGGEWIYSAYAPP